MHKAVKYGLGLAVGLGALAGLAKAAKPAPSPQADIRAVSMSDPNPASGQVPYMSAVIAVWKNQGGVAGTFSPTIRVTEPDGVAVNYFTADQTLQPGQTVEASFSMNITKDGDNIMCPVPN